MKTTGHLLLACILTTLFSCRGSSDTHIRHPGMMRQNMQGMMQGMHSRMHTQSNIAGNKYSTGPNLNDKGVGPIRNLQLEAAINREMALSGEKIFENQCTACHKIDRPFIGPPMKGVTKSRSPEWIMNMILVPDKMLAKDTVAQALLKQFGTPMPDLGLSQSQARDILEYLRTL